MTGLCMDLSHGHLATMPAWAGVPCTRASYDVLEDVLRERQRQREKWGDDSTQDHPDGTDPNGSILDDIGVLFTDATNGEWMEAARDRTDALAKVPGRVTWAHILLEEVAEALSEDCPKALRAELVQVAAVAVKWAEALDRRGQD